MIARDAVHKMTSPAYRFIWPMKVSVFYFLGGHDFEQFFRGHSMTSLPAPSLMDGVLLNSAADVIPLLHYLARDRDELQELYEDTEKPFFDFSKVKLVFFGTRFDGSEGIGDRGSFMLETYLWPNADASAGECIPTLLLHFKQSLKAFPKDQLTPRDIRRFLFSPPALEVVPGEGAMEVVPSVDDEVTLQQPFTLDVFPLIEERYASVNCRFVIQVFDCRFQLIRTNDPRTMGITEAQRKRGKTIVAIVLQDGHAMTFLDHRTASLAAKQTLTWYECVVRHFRICPPGVTDDERIHWHHGKLTDADIVHMGLRLFIQCQHLQPDHNQIEEFIAKTYLVDMAAFKAIVKQRSDKGDKFDHYWCLPDKRDFVQVRRTITSAVQPMTAGI